MSILAPPPTDDSIVEQDETNPQRRDPFYMAKGWVQWLQDALVARVQTALYLLKTLSLTGKTAAISATAIPLGTLAAGRYRVAWYARVTTAAGVSSSLTVTLSWTEGAAALSISGAAMTGNTTTTVQSGVIEIQVDAASAISYATAYASNPATAMVYQLLLSVTRVA